MKKIEKTDTDTFSFYEEVSEMTVIEFLRWNPGFSAQEARGFIEKAKQRTQAESQEEA